MTVELSPTAHTSDAEIPQTALSVHSVGLLALDQRAPSKWTIVPDSPTAHTLVAELPQTPLSWGVVPFAASVNPLETLDQTLPSKRVISPKTPTPHTSDAELPHMA